jgi:hypothetical protein
MLCQGFHQLHPLVYFVFACGLGSFFASLHPKSSSLGAKQIAPPRLLKREDVLLPVNTSTDIKIDWPAVPDLGASESPSLEG